MCSLFWAYFRHLILIIGLSELLTLFLFYMMVVIKGGLTYQLVDLIGIVGVYPTAFKLSWLCNAGLLAMLIKPLKD